jgi:hypothetical protein
VKQWDTVSWAFPHGVHPAVILSRNAVCDLGRGINVLACSSHRATRLPHENEILLDEADGMDWQTLCKLDMIWLAQASELRPRGALSLERRRYLARQLIKLYGLLI